MKQIKVEQGDMATVETDFGTLWVGYYEDDNGEPYTVVSVDEDPVDSRLVVHVNDVDVYRFDEGGYV